MPRVHAGLLTGELHSVEVANRLPIAPAAVPHAAGALGVTHIDRRHSAICIAASVVSGRLGCSASAPLVARVAAPMSNPVGAGHQIRHTLGRAGAGCRRSGWHRAGWHGADWHRAGRRRAVRHSGDLHRLRVRSAARALVPTCLRRIGNKQQNSANQRSNPFHLIVPSVKINQNNTFPPRTSHGFSPYAMGNSAIDVDLSSCRRGSGLSTSLKHKRPAKANNLAVEPGQKTRS